MKMRYYEIVFMIRPDCSDQVSNIIDQCTEIVLNASGKILRTENWGCLLLAYPIKKLHKAYYILLNVKACKDTIDTLNNSVRFNAAIIRSMVVRTKYAITDPSPMMKTKEETQERLIS